MSTLRISGRFMAAAAVLLALVALVASAALAVEGERERVLEPRLSLVGGCGNEEAELDPVEDPGCPAGDHPPAGFFAKPVAIGTDFTGDIFVASLGKKADKSEGRIDIFSPQGTFISELPVPGGPQAMAIDSEGMLYVWLYTSGELVRYAPCGTYDPAAEPVEYCNPPVAVPAPGRGGPSVKVVGLAMNRANDHPFVDFGSSIVEFSSAAEGNEELRVAAVTNNPTGYANGLAVDSLRNRLYAQEGNSQINVYEIDEGLPPGEKYNQIATIEGESSKVPGGNFGGLPSLAVDEGTGHIFVFDTENGHLWELDEEGNYLATVNFPFIGNKAEGLQIAVDNGLTSPNGKLSEENGNGRYVYVPYPAKGIGHSLAFYIANFHAPEVKGATPTGVTEEEAGLQAQINPGNLQTTYVFEIEAEGAAGWTKVGEGTLAAGNLDVGASATASGLTPGTHYSFRVVATNEKGSDEAVGSFNTYASLPAEPSPCPNALLRTGFSALLQDCRAYELVTPADTNGRSPLGAEVQGGGFATRQVSPAGDKVPFRVEGGSLPGFGGTGGLKGDPYVATRTPTGWSTAYIGPSGTEAASVAPGTNSPDQGYSFWQAAGEGSAVLGEITSYVRYPDGHSELVGQGTLGIDPEASGKLISEGGSHIIFNSGGGAKTSTAVQLEPDAAPDGTMAVYDRTPDGTTHVVSLKPGDMPFAAGEDALFMGASFDGVGIAFEVNGTTLYLRYDDKETFRIGEGVEFAGVAEGGGRIFYVENGNLEAFDVATQKVIEFGNTVAEVVPVTVSADGSTAYFVSKSAVPKVGPNPEGASPHVGKQNLYRSKEGQLAFVGTLTESDVVNVLDQWVPVSTSGFLGLVQARSTPDGNVFLFKSHAALTNYASEGFAEVYRYDSGADELRCLSCNPTGAPAQSDADLQSASREGLELFTPAAWPENLRADGRRAFFETSDPLVAGDVDGLQDVYEWEDQGVGSCTQPGGCVFLISSPQSQRGEYLWAVSRSGDDVFFISTDLLTGADADKTPSIYDARVGGGFAESPQAECQGEGCRPQLTSPPLLPTDKTAVEGPGENVKPHRCGKGKRKVKHAGKVRCVKKHRRHAKHRHHRAAAGQKGTRR